LSETVGYEKVKCQLRISPKCRKNHAGFLRRPKYAQEGPWLDACYECACVPYERPKQFQEATE
jgi:hypothetical protein